MTSNRTVLSLMFSLAIASVAVNALAERTTLQLIKSGEKLTAADVKSLVGCKFVYKLKAGMSNSEATDAIEAGFNKFVSCMNAQAAKARVPK